MKKISCLFLLLIMATSTLAFGAEVLNCSVGLSHPDADKLVFYGDSGVRLLSENYEPGDSSSTAGKTFNFVLEEMGSRNIALLFDPSKPTGEAPLNVSINVGEFSGNNELTIMQDIRVDVTALPKFENIEYRNWHVSNLFCIKEPIQECYGSFSNSLLSDIASGKYFNYSVHCSPL